MPVTALATVPPDAEHQVTYAFTSLLNFAELRAELPLKTVQFSKVLNGSGAWSATLDVEDLGIRRSSWQDATAVNRSAMWVDLDGSLLYGGAVTARKYETSSGAVELSGSDFNWYWSQRLQARDYATYTDPEGNKWDTSPGASSLRIAYYFLKQALEKAYSVPIKVSTLGSSIPAEEYWITFSAPEAQQQTASSVLGQIQELGYLVGIDYACDVVWVDGRPTATITLSYPRRGYGGKVVVIDIANALNLAYDEDGTQQATKVVAQAGSLVDRSQGEIYLPSRDAGYPLLETAITHAALAPSEDSRAVLQAYVSGALSVRAFPLSAPVVTLPLFGSPSIFEVDVGMDAILRVSKVAGDQPLNNPLFPNGLEYRFRIVRIDVVMSDEGVSTMALTLNTPVTSAPVEPPELSQEALEKRRQEALEKRETERKEEEERDKETKELEEKTEEVEEETEKTEAETISEEAISEAKKTVEEATSERQKKEAEKALKKAEEALNKAKHAKSRSETKRSKEAAEEAKREAEIAKESGGGGGATKVKIGVVHSGEVHTTGETVSPTEVDSPNTGIIVTLSFNTPITGVGHLLEVIEPEEGHNFATLEKALGSFSITFGMDSTQKYEVTISGTAVSYKSTYSVIYIE